MVNLETSEEDREKSASSLPLHKAALEAAGIALENSVPPLSVTQPLSNFPAQKSTSCVQFGDPQHHPENQPQTELPQNVLSISTESRGTVQSSTSKESPNRKESSPTHQTSTSMKTKQCETASKSDCRDRVLRSGKWTQEEENYAKILIELFEEGRVDEFEKDNIGDNESTIGKERIRTKFKITNGMTLRAYLSRKLFCSPMRISKKFAGKGIGKLVYMSQNSSTYYRPVSDTTFTSPSSTNWNKLIQLKQAESKFLRVAFPNEDPSLLQSTLNITDKILPRNKLDRSDTRDSMSAESKECKYQKMPCWEQKQLLLPQKNEHHCESAANSTPVSTRDAPLSCPGPSQNVGNIVYLPIVPFPANATQMEHKQPCNTNIKVMSSQRQSEAVSTIYSSEPSLITNKVSTPISHKIIQSQQQPSPLMAAPKLLLPSSSSKESECPTTWMTSNNHHTEHGARSQLWPMRCQENQSQIQVLEEAYLTSVSPQKPQVAEGIKNRNGIIAASPVYREGSTISMQKPRLEHSCRGTMGRRTTASQQRSIDVTNSVETGSSTSKNMTSIAQTSTKIEATPNFDGNQGTDNTSKPEIELPNFLSGFDKVSRIQQSNTVDQSSECDLHQAAQYSPAYYTSKSFDDFHRFLGKGLSPKVSPPPKFPNLRTTTAGPAPTVPPIESSEKVVSISNLQMRPRNQQNKAYSGLRMNDTSVSSKFSAPNEGKTRDEIMLSEAFAEAIKGSSSKEVGNRAQTVGENHMHGPCRYNVFENKPAESFRQHSMIAEDQGPRYQSNHNRQHMADGASEFPLEGMTYEDFETLPSCSEPAITSCNTSADKIVTVSDPSDGSEGPNSGGDSDGTHSEEYSKGKRKNMRPTAEQFANKWARTSFQL